MDHQVDQLVRLTGFPTLTTLCGHNLVDESAPNFRGVICGAVRRQQEMEWPMNRDLVLHPGRLGVSVSTIFWEPSMTLTLNRHLVALGNEDLPSKSIPGRRIDIQSLLDKILARLDASKLSILTQLILQCKATPVSTAGS